MKAGLVLVFAIVISIVSTLEYALAAEMEFDTRFIPPKIVEGSEAKILVYTTQDGSVFPKKIDNLRAVSLDASIVKVTDVNSDTGSFVSEITVKAYKAGTTTITLVAPGFSPIEVPIEIFGNKFSQTQLLIKTTPEEYSLDGLTKGYISVQLADEDGFPVLAKQDTVVSLSSSDNNIISILQPEVIIKEGQNHIVTQFEIIGSGDADIYASSLGMKPKSIEINIDDEEDLDIVLYVFPKIINTHTASKGHIIAQLERGGQPVIAKENLRVDLRITNDDYASKTNLSDDLYNSIKTVGYFEIKKGMYWGYTTFTTLSGVEDTYDITISAKKPLVVKTESVETKNLELFDEKIVKIETVPILATGERELIGIMYLEDEGGDPIKASKDIHVLIDSADEDFLQVESVVLRKGDSSVPIYAKVGTSVSEKIDIFPRIEEADIITPTVFGPTKDSLDLIVEPLVNKIISGSKFPIALYLVDGDDVPGFPENSELFVSPSEYVSVEKRTINKGEKIAIVNAESLKEGDDDIQFKIKNYAETINVDSVSSSISEVELVHSDVIFSGTNDVFSVQILNDIGSPVFASKDVEIQFVLKDESLLEIPDSVTIKKGEYYSLFDVAAKASGETELSVLTDGLPIETYEIEITSLEPTLELTVPSIIEGEESFSATLKVTHDDNPLSDMSVKWNVEGGLVTNASPTTGSTGEALLFVLGQSKTNIKIAADVSGSWYSPVSITKTVKVNSTNDSEFMAFGEESESSEYTQFEVFGFDPVLILVPAAIGIGGFMLKKKGMLQIRQ